MADRLQENKMGTMPVGKLLLTMALPMMISMLIQALYNIVDSMYVSRINEDALTAVSLAFPVQNLLISVSTGICVGVNALLSRSLGSRDPETANKAALNGIFMSTIGMLLFVLFGIFGTRAFFASQVDIPQIADYGVTYTTIVCVVSFGQFGEMIFERILQATGRTVYTLFTQGAGAVINIILDPILIFGYFGLPKMGVAGAAWATVIGQVIAFGLAVLFNHLKNREIRLHFRGFRPQWHIIRTILQVGVPSMIMVAIGSVMSYGMNRILLGFQSTAAAVFGVQYKLQSFAFMPIFGLNNGLVPIVAYNYGARNPKRILKAMQLAVITATSLMVAVCLVFELFPTMLLRLFDASDNMLGIGRPALRIISTAFLLAGPNIIMSSTFQALGNGLYSMTTSIVRQLVFLLPAAWLLALTGRLEAVWCAFPIAEAGSLLVSLLLLRRIYRQKIKPLSQPLAQNQ